MMKLRFLFSSVLALGALCVFVAFGSSVASAAPGDPYDQSTTVPATGPKPGEPGYDPTNYCENQWKFTCKSACDSGDVYEPQISCGKNKKELGLSKCCHPKNFKSSGVPQPTTVDQAKQQAAGKSEGELSSQCTSPPNNGVCVPAVPGLASPCGPDQTLSAVCSSDGSSVCCTQSAAAVQNQVGACIKAGGTCSVGSCPSGMDNFGICDSSQDSYCCKPAGENSVPTAAEVPGGGTAATPPPNPFDDTKPAGFDTLKSYYLFEDPLNLQGTNKFPKFVRRIITWALPVIGSLFLVLIIYSGVMWLTAGGDAKQADRARSQLTNSVIGMAIVVLSYAIVTTVINYFGRAVFGP